MCIQLRNKRKSKFFLVNYCIVHSYVLYVPYELFYNLLNNIVKISVCISFVSPLRFIQNFSDPNTPPPELLQFNFEPLQNIFSSQKMSKIKFQLHDERLRLIFILIFSLKNCQNFAKLINTFRKFRLSVLKSTVVLAESL